MKRRPSTPPPTPFAYWLLVAIMLALVFWLLFHTYQPQWLGGVPG